MLKIMGGGIRHVQPNEIYATATPPATSTHFPFAHGMLLKETERLIALLPKELSQVAKCHYVEDGDPAFWAKELRIGRATYFRRLTRLKEAILAGLRKNI